MAREYRGCRGLVFAEIIKDDADGYQVGAVTPLAPVAEISKSTETSRDTHFYDNKGLIVVDSEAGDTVTFTVAIPSDEVYAKLTGRTYDETKKMLIECARADRYFAVGYILGEIGDGGDDSYVWRYKCKFGLPTETSATENNGTDANNISLECTGVYTEYEFENGKGTGVKGSAKAIRMRKKDNAITEAAFFATVITPDTVLPSHALTITQAANTTVTVTRAGLPLASGAAIFDGDVLTISVTGGTITVNGTAFTSGNTLTVSGDVAVVSTAA